MPPQSGVGSPRPHVTHTALAHLVRRFIFSLHPREGFPERLVFSCKNTGMCVWFKAVVLKLGGRPPGGASVISSGGASLGVKVRNSDVEDL